MENIKKNKFIYISVCVGIVILCIIILIFLDKNETKKEEQNLELEIQNNETQNNIVDENFDDKNIYVHITGEVVSPGVIIGKQGDRIKDMIDKAGGTTKDADLSKVNLAFTVEDGQKINIPKIGEKNEENETNTNDNLKNNENIKTNKNTSRSGKNNNPKIESKSEFNSKNYYITSSSGDNIIEGNETNAGTSNNSKVNINTATQTELETLTGVGPSTASKIIKYREQNGKFKKIDDIKNVSGIGEAKFNKIKDEIVV